MINNFLYRWLLKYVRSRAHKTVLNRGIFNGDKFVKYHSNPQKYIEKAIKSDMPMLIARYGTIEFKEITVGGNLERLCVHSGFFPKDVALMPEFSRLYDKASKSIDCLAIWNYKFHGLRALRQKESLIRNYPNMTGFVTISDLDPYYHRDWLSSLAGKRVLVVHPFESTILSQLERGSHMLPKDTSVQVVKAVQTIADAVDSRFNNWFEALEYLDVQISSKNFDICLLGCGAYGLPLGSFIKERGGQAIHMGGALQLLFHIKGKRWDDKEGTIYDEGWIYPLEEDKPEGRKKVENGCYW